MNTIITVTITIMSATIIIISLNSSITDDGDMVDANGGYHSHGGSGNWRAA